MDRLQVNCLKQKTALGLSNEVVTYKRGGAKKALQEVLRHALACPHTPVVTGEPGVGPLRFTITPVHDAKLLSGYVAVKVRAVGKLTSGKKVDQTSYAVYQRRGGGLSRIISFGPNTPPHPRVAPPAARGRAAA